MFLPFACLQSRLHVGNVKVFHHLELSYSGSFGLWPQWLLCLVAFQAKAEDSERNPRESICVLAWWNEFWGIQSWPMRIHELGNSWEPQSPILLIRKYFRWVSHPSHHNDGVWFIPRYLHGIFFFTVLMQILGFFLPVLISSETISTLPQFSLQLLYTGFFQSNCKFLNSFCSILPITLRENSATSI